MTDVDKEQSEKQEASAQGRAAYGDAMALLRGQHRDEFDDLLDKAYAGRGLVSPRQKRIERQAAEAAGKAEKDAARASKIAARVEKARAALAAAEAAQADFEQEPLLALAENEPTF